MSIISKLKSMPKTTIGLIAMLVASVVIPSIVLAWGPMDPTVRPTYTSEGADHVTFNSIVYSKANGDAKDFDERNFVKVGVQGADYSTFTDDMNLVAGGKYTMFVYYHNNAKTELNKDRTGIAINTKVIAKMPAVVEKGSTAKKAQVTISADNASPKSVFDEVYFSNKTTGDLVLHYINDSAVIHNTKSTNGQHLPDDLFKLGAPIGSDSLTSGEIPGCSEFSGYITYDFVADQPNFTVEKMVRKSTTASGGWAESIAVNTGDNIDYQIKYTNTGTTQQDNVVIKDILPKGVSYVDGSTYVKIDGKAAVKVSDNITGVGINLGNFAGGVNANTVIKITAKVTASESSLTCGQNTLKNIGRVETDNGAKEDTADVVIAKTCVTPVTPVTPVVPVTPVTQLPHTGPVSDFAALFGIGSLVTTLGYFLASRRESMVK